MEVFLNICVIATTLFAVAYLAYVILNPHKF